MHFPARVIRCFAAVAALLPVAAFAQTSVSIHDVMKSLPGGPYLGQTVSTSGIVVGVNAKASGEFAFYISEPSGNWDSLRETAEGMPIFASSVAACSGLADGDVVTVVGRLPPPPAPERSSRSSTTVFHSPHSWHRPIHFEYFWPQL